jgi:hypothetical protein
MMTSSRFLCALMCLTLAAPIGAHAGTYAARVRWQPSTDPAVVGYRVYKRTVNGTYGPAQDAVTPTPGLDGTLSVLVNSLDVRTDYAFAATAYTGDGSESGRSNELLIGYADVADMMDSDGDGLTDAEEDVNLNRVVDAGETDPNNPDTDGDGVRDGSDQCRGTAAGAAVNSSGCACAQITCDNGNPCDGAEGCVAGVCAPGTPPSCDDGNPCTTDACSPASGCTHVRVSGCSACSTNAHCDDGNACTTDTCGGGTCQYAPVANGTACADGNPCNGAETCQAGVCAAGTPLTCDDANPCTTDTCSPSSGCVHAPSAACSACETATPIPAAGGTVTGQTSGTSALAAGCVPSSNLSPEVVFAWTPSASGSATIATCGTGTSYDTVLSLRRGSCTNGAELGCNDDACAISGGANRGSRITAAVTAGETYYIVVDGYNGRSGAFTLTVTPPAACSAASCDDNNPCTTDVCGTNGTCTNTRIAGCTACTSNAHCDDGNACNGAETCQAGLCTAGTTLTCDDGDACTTDTCNPSSGCVNTRSATCTVCEAATRIPAAGGTVTGRTSGASALTAGCVPTSSQSPEVVFVWTPAASGSATIATCGTGTSYDTVLSLRQGACTDGAEIGCNDDSCPVNGSAIWGSRITAAVTAGETYYVVVDGYKGRSGAFTLTVTPPAGGCTTASCNDGNPCTTDVCGANGTCTNTPIAGCTGCTSNAQCDDGNPCTTDGCSAGTCRNTAKANGTSCSDGNACNGAEACQAGACATGTPPVCNDGNPCTNDSCDPSRGCTYTNNTDPCTDDGNPCTNDVCGNGTCKHPAKPNGASCADTTFCNGEETCRSGVCTAATALTCDDGIPCTADACDETGGRCTHEAGPGCCRSDAECADTDACTANERCDRGACVSDPVVCPDVRNCAVATCDPEVGCSATPVPDGTACDDGDPCTSGEACSAGTCSVAEAGAQAPPTELGTSKFRLKPKGRRRKMIAAGSFLPSTPIDCTLTGASVEVVDRNGTVLYSAFVPGAAFTTNRERNYFLYNVPWGWSPPPGSNGLKKLVLWLQSDTVAVVVKGINTDLSQAAGQDQLTWALRFGDQCARRLKLTCETSRTGVTVCQ